ncbi:DNA-binding transcriptional LysR family regulator [Saccharopolyspora erythraea NRRL 2338]|uniref:Transcriptional regulator, LysR family n=2 Tax=Saccharopolyspora erythraea TaxID=1836 RepID=A4FGV5_SACEN|nr:LysR family transcriptional regulator [Saccharopolyspora erythraea]EQD82611.1 LysR family transcriptional regulator [Saccharopolyspora erythraea D]PFG96984.1 DNA-binding transcriptional LysR family regulator [Saccharopolyspora erythraea NRRL 2338]QRK87199.1 LysR family transcriptional regulator [Saccharopolyspora erythraea]CAM03280.1 transcriptional regulator, LysR family [Saccharopolyspora erythraea NRRL 2338]
MEFRHLAGFVAVAEELHFGRAAARLHIAQPPLSQQIRQLEHELGVQLFERNTRSVRLTSAGQAMLDPARQVLADLDVATRAAQAGGRGEIGRVSIGFAGASSHETLPRLTRAVRARHPGIELVLRGQTYSGEALNKVAEGELDLGFVRLPVRRDGVAVRLVEHEHLVAALPAEHRVADRNEINLPDLADEPFVTFPGTRGSAVRDALVHACVTAGFHPRIVQEAPDSYTILALVGAGVGVTLTVSSVQHIRTEGMVYRPLAGPTQPMSLALAWRRDNPSAALRCVLAVSEEAMPTPE